MLSLGRAPALGFERGKEACGVPEHGGQCRLGIRPGSHHWRARTRSFDTRTRVEVFENRHFIRLLIRQIIPPLRLGVEEIQSLAIIRATNVCSLNEIFRLDSTAIAEDQRPVLDAMSQRTPNAVVSRE
jgi:hypothetical protein